ncbi:hypothetical protein PWR66_17395 [Paraburkholderia sp. A1RO-5]|uniref:SH3 domain-containing protein n=1 Tax=Paraburkholderia sp. A1RO-5 TaxID=3028369 RepID=UPI003B82A709
MTSRYTKLPRGLALPLATVCVAAGMVFAASGVRAQTQAYTNEPVDLFAGPSDAYPVVSELGPNVPVTVMGCVSDYSWCDVALPGLRGWVYGGYLSYPYQGAYVPLTGYGAVIGLPIVTFSVGAYWGSFYRDRPWYGDRDRWEHAPPPGRGRPPEPQRFHGGRPTAEGGHRRLHPEARVRRSTAVRRRARGVLPNRRVCAQATKRHPFMAGRPRAAARPLQRRVRLRKCSARLARVRARLVKCSARLARVRARLVKCSVHRSGWHGRLSSRRALLRRWSIHRARPCRSRVWAVRPPLRRGQDPRPHSITRQASRPAVRARQSRRPSAAVPRRRRKAATRPGRAAAGATSGSSTDRFRMRKQGRLQWASLSASDLIWIPYQ